MKLVKRIQKWWNNLHPFSRVSVKAGAATMTCFYITGLLALALSSYGNYFSMMNVYRGCLEAAPASMAAAVCAGLLGDLMMRGRGQDDNQDKKQGK